MREDRDARDNDSYNWMAASGRGKQFTVSGSAPLLPKIIVFSQYLVFLDQIVIDLKLAGDSFVIKMLE